MTARLRAVAEPDEYVVSLRDQLLNRTEDARQAVADLILCLGWRISGGQNRRAQITEAFDCGYQAGYHRGRKGGSMPSFD